LQTTECVCQIGKEQSSSVARQMPHAVAAPPPEMSYTRRLDFDGTPVVVFTSGNYVEAQFVASVLDGSGIQAFVVDDNACRLYPQAAPLFNGVKVVVSGVDAERAIEVLGSVGTDKPIIGEVFPGPLSLGAALLTMIRNWFSGKPKHSPPDT